VEEIRNIIIRNQGGRRIVLGDVADVYRGTKDREVIARLNGKESVELAVYKEADANTVTVAGALQQRLASLQKANLMPKDVSYQIVFNQAEFIKMAIDDVLSSAIMGGLLAIAVLFLFLRDLKSTLIIGLTIPVSILGTFGLMYQTGISLNLMSLGGVALAVGMLVDNSIVAMEAVHRKKQTGLPLREAVYLGTREVAGALAASTLTSVAVFLPLVFVVGVAGQLFRDQALTITYGLLVSLFVAFTLTPMVLAIQARKAFEEREASSEIVAPEAQLSEKPLARRLQLMSRWTEKKWRTAAKFLFHDVARILLTDIRRGVRATGRGISRVIDPGLDLFDAGYRRFSKGYPRVVEAALNHKGMVLVTALSLFAAAVFIGSQLGAELIPSLTQGEFQFEVRLPEGKALQQTDSIVRSMEQQVMAYTEVGSVYSSVGGSNKNQFARESKEENVGQLYVVMKSKNDKAAEARVIDRMREMLRKYPEVAFTFSRPTLFSVKTPVEVEIYAYDLDSQRKAAEAVAARMQQIRGLYDIHTSTELGNPEIQVRFDREKLARMGLDEGTVSNAVRSKVRGDVATRYREDDKQIEILVRADERQRNTIESIQNLLINVPTTSASPTQGVSSAQAPTTPSPEEVGANSRPATSSVPADRPPVPTGVRGVPVRLGAIADVTVGRGPSQVRRIRAQRAAVVSANLSGRDLTSTSDEIRSSLQDLRGKMPADVTLQLGGQNEELSTSYNSLMLALSLAVFLVYLVMASEFESFLHPLIVLFSVPLGMIGVVFALVLTNTTVSVMVLLGVIILIGVVVNNAIVLIDYTNQLREEGYSKREALKVAGEVRLRPILMTTLTTVLGLLPMALGWGEGAEIRSPMAIAVIGGMTCSTALTLVFIPVMYELLDRKRYAGDVKAHASETQPSLYMNPTPSEATGD
jgi:HAE1 family hydrophobic/amphiphilic exporter-1